MLFRSIADDVGLAVNRAVRGGATVLLEGAQGSLLDIDHGTYPYVTSSSTTAGGAATGAGIGPRAIHAALGVVKAYTTRVGAGPLPTEFDEVMGEQVRTLGNEFGATTGRPRRCGWFDAVVVRYAVRVNGLSALAVTKLDVLDTLGRIGLCTGYSVGNETLEEFPGGARRRRIARGRVLQSLVRPDDEVEDRGRVHGTILLPFPTHGQDRTQAQALPSGRRGRLRPAELPGDEAALPARPARPRAQAPVRVPGPPAREAEAPPHLRRRRAADARLLRPREPRDGRHR